MNLEDNFIELLPEDLSRILGAVENINLNGNNFEDEKFEQVIDALSSMPNLRSLFINLHEEEQVDLVMRKLPELEFLNGLPVERDEDEERDQQESSSPKEDMQRF